MTVPVFWRWWAAAVACLVSAMSVAAARTGAAESHPPRLPQQLSETGLFSDVASLTVDPRHRAFSPQYPLWTDSAQKRRWVSLPTGTTIDVRDIDAWSFPTGTRFWKEFSFGGQRVETRMLVKSSAGWEFGSYAWNDAQTDAALAPPTGIPNLVEVANGKRHSVPSVEDCRACHDSNRTEVLGFTALQLSDDRDAEALHAEPLGEGMLTLRDLVAEQRLQPARPELVSTPPRIPAASPRSRAALGYLSTNCGACHNTDSSLASLGLTFRQPAYSGGLAVVSPSLKRRTKWDRPGAVPETTVVVDHSALEQSALLLRMRSRRPASQMPPLGTVLPDHDAIDVMTRWVREDLSSETDR
jgi:hypothetical protein